MHKILLLHIEAGHGHKKVAEAVAQELKKQNPPDTQVEIRDALEFTDRQFAVQYPKIYFWMVMHAPWLWGFFFYFTDNPLVYWFIKPLRHLWNFIHAFNLRKHLQKNEYDMLIFTHFLPAEVAASMKRKGLIKSKLITIVTDVIPHQVWINQGTDLYWAMAEESKAALINRGISAEKILVKGIPISSIFNEPISRNSVNNKFGFSDNRFTILFTSGSFGTGPTEELLEILKDWKEKVQAIVVCGKNQPLFDLLQKKKDGLAFPVHIFGFINNMHEMMSAADLMFAKPGGATMCESLVKKVAMIIMSPIPGQETYNAKWLIQHNAAVQIEKAEEIRPILKSILETPEKLNAMLSSIESIAKPNAARDMAEFVLKSLKNE